MTIALNYLVLVLASLFLVAAAADARRSNQWLRFGGEAAVVVGLLLIFYVWLGFPSTPRLQSFGGGPPLWLIGVMFVCVALGIAARYVFFLRGRPRWQALLKPLCVSPMILLPLLGSIHGVVQLEAIQTVSFSILAFQNGFFWNVVLERAKHEV